MAQCFSFYKRFLYEFAFAVWKRLGYHVNRKRIQRLMRLNAKGTIILMQVWSADITYIPLSI